MNKNLMFVLLLASCGANEATFIKGLDGKDGAKGSTGATGSNGHSLVSEYLSASELECSVSGSRLDIYLDLDDSLTVSEGDIYANSLVACNGSNGLNGEQGIQGEQGPQGEVGPQGLQGVAGNDGSNGEDGEDGTDGEDGQDGAVGPQGAQGIAGPVGPTGPQGPQGTQGIQGVAGAAGTNGTDGINATASISPSTSTCTLIVGNYYMANNSLYLENDSTHCDGTHDKVSLNNGDSVWVSANKLVLFDGTLLKLITFN